MMKQLKYCNLISYSSEKNRKVSGTKMNQSSSRSHCIFKIILEYNCIKENIIKKSEINLIDLAGSEGVNKSDMVGKQLKEGANINKSLWSITNIIKKLYKGEKFVSFRESKLTRIWQPYIMGYSYTCVLCCINPDKNNYYESLNTLRFALCAGGLIKKNDPNKNSMLNKNNNYRKELENKKLELENYKKLYKNMDELEDINKNLKNFKLNIKLDNNIDLLKNDLGYNNIYDLYNYIKQYYLKLKHKSKNICKLTKQSKILNKKLNTKNQNTLDLFKSIEISNHNIESENAELFQEILKINEKNQTNKNTLLSKFEQLNEENIKISNYNPKSQNFIKTYLNNWISSIKKQKFDYLKKIQIFQNTENNIINVKNNKEISQNSHRIKKIVPHKLYIKKIIKLFDELNSLENIIKKLI